MMREKYKGFISKYGYFFEWYYLLVILVYILTLVKDLVRPGVIASALLILVWVEVFLSDPKGFKGFSIQDWLVFSYFVYNILSVIWLTLGGLPASVFLGEFVVSVLPLGFYFAGRLCGERLAGFYEKFTLAVLVVGIVGILLYIAAPQFYLDYSFRYLFISKADAPTMRVRMNSVVGCTLLGFLGTAGMMSGAYFLKTNPVKAHSTIPSERANRVGSGRTSSEGKGNCPVSRSQTCEWRTSKAAGSSSRGISNAQAAPAAVSAQGNWADTGKETSRVKSSRIFGILSIVICLIVAVMSNQRSVLVSAILVMIYINYLLFFKLDLIPKKYFYAELCLIAAVFVLLCIIKFDVILKFWWRLASLPGAVSERSEQWIAAINNMYSTWLGNGLGANGHRALGIEGTHVIADGGLIKLYCEEGILGFSLFLYIVILAVKKGLSNVREYYVELGILALVFLQSIGSNIIAFQLATPIFWFAIGRIQAPEGAV